MESYLAVAWVFGGLWRAYEDDEIRHEHAVLDALPAAATAETHLEANRDGRNDEYVCMLENKMDSLK